MTTSSGVKEKLMAGLAEYRAKLDSGEIDRPVRLDPLQKALANPGSLKLAIRAACWDCVGGDATPNWQDEVKHCPVLKCGLHHVRAYKQKTNEPGDF